MSDLEEELKVEVNTRDHLRLLVDDQNTHQVGARPGGSKLAREESFGSKQASSAEQLVDRSSARLEEIKKDLQETLAQVQYLEGRLKRLTLEQDASGRERDEATASAGTEVALLHSKAQAAGTIIIKATEKGNTMATTLRDTENALALSLHASAHS